VAVSLIGTIIVGAAGSIFAAFIIWFLARTGRAVFLFGESHLLAARLRRNGVTKFHFSRDDYDSLLPTYLSQANHSIQMVSISLGLTHSEGDLLSFFRRRIQATDFRITISLLDPTSEVIKIAALSLGVTTNLLKREIVEMLRGLISLRESLSQEHKARLQIFVHDTLPMGSAILIDAQPTSGKIQIETKLYRAPRIESFGYEIVGPSPFYKRNYTAWTRVIEDSEPVQERHLIDD
jgi:hypothetical protein